MKGKYFTLKHLLAGALLTAGILLVPAVKAQTIPDLDPAFNPNLIISDDDMFNVHSMSYDYFINFIKSKGVLASLKVTDIDGLEKTAADVIWRVAQSYKINPKYLLVLLQKEQSLVHNPNPSERSLDWATGYAVCDSCSKDDPSIQEFKGFANQLEWAAKQHREKYLMQLLTFGVTIAGRGVGKSMDINGQIVTPANNATAMLYTYTPHIRGNYNLWQIWRRWFSLPYPNGTIVRGNPSQQAYLIQNGVKKKFANESVLLSMAEADKAISASDTELSNYPDGETIKFTKYSLIKTEKDNLYLITGSGKRQFESQKAFYKFGFIEDELIPALEEDLSDLALLQPITEKDIFPMGALVKTDKSSTVWYVENGIKYPLLDEVFLKLYFTRRPIKTVAHETVETYETGQPYTFNSGELVKGNSDPVVYVVEDNYLRPIPSEEVFEKMGWKWSNIVIAPDRVIAVQNIGQAIELPHLNQPGTVQTAQE